LVDNLELVHHNLNTARLVYILDTLIAGTNLVDNSLYSGQSNLIRNMMVVDNSVRGQETQLVEVGDYFRNMTPIAVVGYSLFW
jgi:hypothetical protein